MRERAERSTRGKCEGSAEAAWPVDGGHGLRAEQAEARGPGENKASHKVAGTEGWRL